jgi:hypothetical protein
VLYKNLLIVTTLSAACRLTALPHRLEMPRKKRGETFYLYRSITRYNIKNYPTDQDGGCKFVTGG